MYAADIRLHTREPPMTYLDGEASMKRRTEGRYDPKRSARMPANGLARPPVTKNVSVALAVVPDPMEPGRELYVTTNRHVDVLENERSHRRISEAAYRIGRDLQEVFEKGARVGSGSQWREGDRVDMQVAKETAIARNVDIARKIDIEMRRLTSEVGILGANFLRTLLSGTTFAEYSAQTRGGSRGAGHVGERFRRMLEEIVELREARGPNNGRFRSLRDDGLDR